MAAYNWYVGDLRTGKIARQVDLVDARWTTSFDYSVAGTLEGKFPLRAVDPDTGLPVWPTARADTAAGKSFLAVAYQADDGTETFIEAGPIWTAKYDDADGFLSFGAAGLSSYFDRRKPIPVTPGHPEDLGPEGAAATFGFALTGSSVSNATAYLMSNAVDADPGGPYSTPGVPLVHAPYTLTQYPGDLGLVPKPFPADGTYIYTMHGYELPQLGEAFRQITQRDGGPEIQLVPRRRIDDPRFLEWEIRIGYPNTSMMLTQDGPPWSFDRTVSESDVRDIDIDSDGTGLATRMWAAGEGEAEGRPIYLEDSLELTDLGWPIIEGETQATDSVSDFGILRDLARGELSRRSRPREQWNVVVSRDGRPNLGQYRPGDWATVRVRRPRLPPRRRLLHADARPLRWQRLHRRQHRDERTAR